MSHGRIGWQFSSADLAAVEHWLARASRLGDAGLGEVTIVRFRDEYFDTKDWTIYRTGNSLRIRQSGHHRSAILERLVADDTTLIPEGVTEEIAGTTAGRLFNGDGPVTERIRLVCRRRVLRALAQVEIIRRERRLRLEDGTALLRLERTACVSGGANARLQRVELEVIEGAPGAFESFVEAFRTACSLTPTSTSSFVWALSAVGETPPQRPRAWPPTISDATTAEHLGVENLLAHGALVRWNEPGTRLGDDPEYVHDMRVAARHMRAAIRILREAGWGSGAIDEMESALRTLGSALGGVRDLDVRIEQLERLRASLVVVPPESLDPYVAMMKEDRDHSRKVMLQYLDSSLHRKLIASISPRRLKNAGKGKGTAGPVHTVAPRLIRKARRKAVRLGDALSAGSDASEYHRLRILCKRLRYALELLEPAYGDAARPMIQAAVKVQDLLGELRDAHLAIRSLQTLLREPRAGLPAAAHCALGEVAQMNKARQVALLLEFPATFGKLHGKAWKGLKQELIRRAQAVGG